MIGQGHNLFCIEAYPIRYLANLKAGSTFIKTLLYRLETGLKFSQPNKIHQLNRVFPRHKHLGLTAVEIREEEFAFTTLRDPVSRFESLFKSKFFKPPTSVPETSHPNNLFDEIYWYLNNHSRFDFTPTSIKDQQSNAHCLLDAIQAGFEGEQKVRINPHWARQNALFPSMKDGQLKVLLMEDLNAQLALLLSTLIPDITEVVASLGRPNRSDGQQKIPNFLDKSLIARIEQLYDQDIILHQRFTEAWAKLDFETRTHIDIPRAT